jgi:hypothetical protein
MVNWCWPGSPDESLSILDPIFMSLTLATLIPGLILIVAGAPLLLNHSGYTAILKAFPRSTTASYVFFGLGAAWFLYAIWHLSPADFGEYRTYLFIGFLFVAILSFRCVPDFLAVRGLATIVLMAAMPLLEAAYMEYEKPQRLFMVTAVYAALSLAIWLGAQPWRLRDFFNWLFAQPARARGLGGALTVYGVVLAIVAFTY